jgi:two-component system, OmpR family, phosphate regulon sensor histidine kinase PhoR
MFKKIRLSWQLFASYLILLFFAVFSVYYGAGNIWGKWHLERSAEDLRVRALLLAERISEQFESQEDLQEICVLLGKKSQTRFTVISKAGLVLCDSFENPLFLDNHSTRPEVISAFDNFYGMAVRYSTSLKKDTIYVAVPIIKNGQAIAVARAALPVRFLHEELQKIKAPLAIFATIVILIAALLSWFLSKHLGRVFNRIKKQALQIAQGDFKITNLPEISVETDGLVKALKDMAGQLEERIKTVENQKNELEIVLGGMVEGVVALDLQNRIVRMNKAACRLLGVGGNEWQGKFLHETLRDPDLKEFVNKIFETGENSQKELVFFSSAGTRTCLHANASVLRDASAKINGVLLVLHDVTRLQNLEQVRKDFVANVSHELKTPITSIKGFVETLEDGALENFQDARRFLSIISRHAERMNAIVDDLLVLSRLEANDGPASLEKKECGLREVLEETAKDCELKINQKNIKLLIECPENIKVKLNAPLMEQAIFNLLDNAVKYSEAGQSVTISGFEKNGTIIISVRDYGIGIGAEHLPRLFERFYRVDKARDRSQGGTGLGLAIVKHIVGLHQGKVLVESEQEKGSCFSIVLPKNPS